jgi:hypothetical protein
VDSSSAIAARLPTRAPDVLPVARSLNHRRRRWTSPAERRYAGKRLVARLLTSRRYPVNPLAIRRLLTRDAVGTRRGGSAASRRSVAAPHVRPWCGER